MKILELHVEGFRSLKNVTWKPGDLNVVIGPNASGKSNLLKLLEMLSVAADGRLSRYLRKLGGIETQMWNQAGVNDALSIDMTVNQVQPLDYGLDWPGNPHYAISLASTARGDHLFAYETFSAATPDNITYFDRDDQYYWVNSNGEAKQTLTNQDPDTVNKRFDEEALLSQFVEGPLSHATRISAFQQEVSNIRVYQWFDTSPNSDVRRGTPSKSDAIVDSDGQNFASVLNLLYNENREFSEDVDKSMIAAFGTAFERIVFLPVTGGKIVVGVQWKDLDKPTAAWDLSDGTLRFLYLLTVLGGQQLSSIVAIDQPESDLHPNMLPVLAEVAVRASHFSQVIFTTHSVQLLDAFKVTDTVPAVTVALWEDGETKLTTFEEDELKPWLELYSLGALFNSGTLEAIA